MSIAPVRHLGSSPAGRFILTVVGLALTTAAFLVLGWALVEALRPSGSMPLAPGPLPLPSPRPGSGGL